MAFGLASVPFSFQNAMFSLFADLQPAVLIYLGDILIVSATLEEHLNTIEMVFQRLQGANLVLNSKKCVFATDRTPYLGHIISSKGITVDPSKIEAVLRLTEPKTKKELQSFLGLTNFYRKFIEGYSHLFAPLYDLCGSDQFVWTSAYSRAFKKG